MANDTDPQPVEDAPSPSEARRGRGNLFALEICFLAFVAIVTLAAFFEALTYQIVSARTPFVIMVPLFVLIVVHAARLWGARAEFSPKTRIAEALSGATPGFNKVLGISAWLVVMVLMILILGHVVGILLFCMILMRFVAGESWKITLLTAAGTALFIYGLFEFIFDIDLYRGLILRYFLGFRDF